MMDERLWFVDSLIWTPRLLPQECGGRGWVGSV
jgi:hypothetical protein